MKYDNFFSRNTKDVAQDLLGRMIIRRTDSGIYAAMISETGAYVGLVGADPHGPRKVMFYDAGKISLMPHRGHLMLNIASGESDPACVEIRELRGERRIEGSGAITNFLKIPADLDGKMLGYESGVFITEEKYGLGKASRSSGQADNCKGIYSLA